MQIIGEERENDQILPAFQPVAQSVTDSNEPVGKHVQWRFVRCDSQFEALN